MPAQIKTLTKLELANIFGLNVFLHTKDKKARKVKLLLAVVVLIVGLAFAGYMGGVAYGLIILGMPDIVIAYLTVLSSILILVFNVLKAGNVIFRRNGYDMFSALPLSQATIVISRFARMYVENLILTSIVLLPGMGVYGVFLRPGAAFYAMGVAGILLIPLIPMSVAVFIGALIKAISSRMRNKSIVEIVLSLGLMAAVFAATYGLNDMAMGGEVNKELLVELSGTIGGILETLYPPAGWLGRALTAGRFPEWLLFAGVSVIFTAAVVSIVSLRFHAICRALFGTSARHDYQMQALSQDSLLISLCRRELKRYLSSGIYVTNTIAGPIMGAALSIGIFVVGVPTFFDEFPISLNVREMIPFLVAAVFCMMNMACVSVSMEGKNWWIVKSLPIPPKTILDAKILVSLIVAAPFYLAAVIFLLLGLKPGILDVFWIIFVPVLFLVFASVFGIMVNLRLPVMNWDNEVSVVKQSAAGMVGGMGGGLILLICTLLVGVIPAEYSVIGRLGICLVIFAATVLLYQRNLTVDLRKIE